MKTLKSVFTAQFEALNTKLENRTARLGVIGLGYVGLPLVLLFSDQKFRVTGFDIDQKKVKTLLRGRLLHRAHSGYGDPVCTGCRFLADQEIIRAFLRWMPSIIAVPTPLDHHHEPDLSFIEATAKSIAPHLRPGQLVVLESTTYPGTTEELLVPILENNHRS